MRSYIAQDSGPALRLTPYFLQRAIDVENGWEGGRRQLRVEADKLETSLKETV